MLEFLVRDWSWPDEYEYGGSGGDKLLKEIFQVCRLLLFIPLESVKIISMEKESEVVPGKMKHKLRRENEASKSQMYLYYEIYAIILA